MDASRPGKATLAALVSGLLLIAVACATGSVNAYVNGERSSGDPSQIALRGHELVQLDVGDETPPRPFSFPPGL